MARIEFVDDADPYAEDIRELLVLTDEEFHPPLSGRDGPTQTSDLDTVGYNFVSDFAATGRRNCSCDYSRQYERTSAIDDYHNAVMEQPFILTLVDDRVVGFLAFRHGYDADAVGDFAPSNYASTLVVHPDHRRHGYARQMYDLLLTDLPDDYQTQYVTTRTWSENEGHLTLLDTLGFQPLTTIENDRGEGIHTVYYGIDVAKYDSE